jgi:regulator of protease activity HflC (stomatin/prohibitin superfamily)
MIVVLVIVAIIVVAFIVIALSARVIKQYERVVLFERGKVKAEARGPGLLFIIPLIDRVHRVSLGIITLPIQSQASREKRGKIIAAQGEALAAGELAHASDVMMAHPLALQLRNLQTLVEVAVDKNSTVVFPAPLMSTIAELGAFLTRESKAARDLPVPAAALTNGEVSS